MLIHVYILTVKYAYFSDINMYINQFYYYFYSSISYAETF